MSKFKITWPCKRNDNDFDWAVLKLFWWQKFLKEKILQRNEKKQILLPTIHLPTNKRLSLFILFIDYKYYDFS